MKDIYKIYKELSKKFPEKKLVISGDQISGTGLNRIYRSHREMIIDLFKKEGVEVYRFAHDYDSTDGNHPSLGLVFRANDSVVEPGLEVLALIGHNARYINAAGD